MLIYIVNMVIYDMYMSRSILWYLLRIHSLFQPSDSTDIYR